MAALPTITITYANGALGQVASSADGLLCLCVAGAVEVADKFALGSPYSIRRPADLDTFGITAEINALLHRTVIDFYQEAPEGTQVYIVGFPGTLTMSAMLDKNNPYLRSIIEKTNGALRGLVVTKVATANPTITNGLNSDMAAAMLNAQTLGDWSESAKYAPIFTILDGLNFDGNAQNLSDLRMNKYNRVSVVVGSTSNESPNQAVGLVAGRIARNSVDVNIGYVGDGALNTLAMYAGETPIETADVATIHDKAYLTFQTYTGIAGYYIADDLLATAETDDYRTITARRTIDKAYRIAYATLLPQLKGKVNVRSDGTMLQPVIVSWEQMVKNAIAMSMTRNGELSDDNGDGGVECFIDPTQNVLSTSEINTVLRVRPFGYARFINVLLGFTVVNS